MRPRYRCHRFGALLRWGNRFLSWIRVQSCDYSRVTRVRVLLTFLTTSLRYLRILVLLGITWCDTPSFLAYPRVVPHVRSLYWVFSLLWPTVVLASIAKTITAPILLQCGFVGGFFPNFAIFALVLDHLRNF